MSFCLSTFLIIQFCSYTICYHEVLEVLEELFLSIFDGLNAKCRYAYIHHLYLSICLSIYTASMSN